MNDSNFVPLTPTEQPVNEASKPAAATEPAESVTPPAEVAAPEQPAAPTAPTAPVPPVAPAAPVPPAPQAPTYYGGPVPPYNQPYNQPYGQPPYGMPPYGPYATPQEDGNATASMVLGILSLLSVFVMGFFFGIVPLVLGIVALALGISARKRVKGGKSLAGIICGSIGLAFGALILVLFVIIFVAALTSPEFYSEFNDYGYYSEAARLLSLIK